MFRKLRAASRGCGWSSMVTSVVLGVLVMALPAWSQEGQSHQKPKIEKTTQKKKANTDTKNAEKTPVTRGELVVTAPRMDIPIQENPAATTVVDKADLSAMPRSIAADEALAAVPGVKVDNQANGERVHLSIRGQGILTERGIRGITVLLDGIPLNDPTGFVPDLFDVDWATVNRIEVVAGPASSLYGGGGSGGIINITTDDGGELPIGGEARIDVGSHGFSKYLAQAGGSEGGVNYRFSASRNQGDGYRVHTAFQSTNLYGKVHFGGAGKLQVNTIVSGTSFFNENAEGLNLEQVLEDPSQPNPDALTFNEYQRTRRGTLGFTGSYQVSDRQKLTFTLYGRHTQYRESVPSSVIHRTYDGYGGSLEYSVESTIGSLKNYIGAGVDLKWQDLKEYKRPNLGGGREDAVVVSDQLMSQRGTGIFAFDRLDLGRNWNLIVGARYDDHQNELDDKLQADGVDLSGDDSFSKSTARIGAAWNWKPSLGFYANWGQGFLPPATEELANNPDSLGGFNRELQPATSNSFELGARGYASSDLSFDVGVFRLMTDGDFGRYRIPERPLETFYRNAGDSSRYGLETRIDWLPIDSLKIRMAYTYSDFTYDKVNIGDDVLSDTRLPNSPQNMAYLDVEYTPVEHLMFGAAVDTRSRAFIDGTNATWIDGYTLVHLRMSYEIQLGPRTVADIVCAVRNLGDTDYIAFTEPDPDGNSYQPGPGREFFGGFSLNF